MKLIKWWLIFFRKSKEALTKPTLRNRIRWATQMARLYNEVAK